MVNSHAGRLEPGWNESILASARSRVSCTRSSARSPLPLSEIAKARRLGTDARMSSRSSFVRGITPSRHFFRPLFPSWGSLQAHQAFESALRIDPVLLAVQHLTTWL